MKSKKYFLRIINIVLFSGCFLFLNSFSVYAIDDLVSEDLGLSGFFVDEDGVSVPIYLPQCFDTELSQVRIFGVRSGTLYKHNRRLEAYEDVIRQICTRPLANSPNYSNKVESILKVYGLSSDIINNVKTAVEWLSMCNYIG